MAVHETSCRGRFPDVKSKCRVEAELSSPFPLTGREIALLCAITPDEKIRAHEIADRIGLSASRASRLLVWKQDEKDRRAALITLSAKGLDICTKIEAVKCSCEERLLSRLGRENLKAVKKGLELLTAAL
ncbi:MAG: hypothetical protein EHM28_04840 [Spirochaetaceae bacterium]|nr:MAG: hypothetical protein EHM28_04840 [Spirochaetaceae bacterium]